MNYKIRKSFKFSILIGLATLFLISVSAQNIEEGTTGYTDHFKVSSTGTQEITGLGFEPDAIRFHVTNTINSYDADQKLDAEEHGQGHGFAQCSDGNCENIGLTAASGSASMNGQAQSSSDQYSIYQAITNNDGTNINGWIRGSLVNTDSDGFTIDINRADQGQYVTYTAYNFGENSDVDVDYFNSPTSTGTQTVSTGNSPNFLNIKMTPQITSIDQNIQNGADDGWMHGYAAENEKGIEQLSMSKASYSNNRDDHVFASSDSNIIRLLRAASKGGITGRMTASLDSFNSEGFTLDYSNTDSGQIGIYMAVETELTPEVGYNTTPTSTGAQEISTDASLDHLQLLSSNTISDIDVEGFSGGNNNDNNMGWMFGAGNETQQRSMMVATHSNSHNGHAVTSSDSQMFRMLYSEQDQNIRGRETASLTDIGENNFTLDWNTVEDSSNSYVPYDTLLVGYYGFTEVQNNFCDSRGLKNECIFNTTRSISTGTYNISTEFESREEAIVESLNGLSTFNITNSSSISGFWRGSFFIDTPSPVLKSGAQFRPENGNIRIGN